jgi:hypothetical protein
VVKLAQVTLIHASKGDGYRTVVPATGDMAVGGSRGGGPFLKHVVRGLSRVGYLLPASLQIPSESIILYNYNLAGGYSTPWLKCFSSRSHPSITTTKDNN